MMLSGPSTPLTLLNPTMTAYEHEQYLAHGTTPSTMPVAQNSYFDQRRYSAASQSVYSGPTDTANNRPSWRSEQTGSYYAPSNAPLQPQPSFMYAQDQGQQQGQGQLPSGVHNVAHGPQQYTRSPSQFYPQPHT